MPTLDSLQPLCGPATTQWLFGQAKSWWYTPDSEVSQKVHSGHSRESLSDISEKTRKKILPLCKSLCACLEHNLRPPPQAVNMTGWSASHENPTYTPRFPRMYQKEYPLPPVNMYSPIYPFNQSFIHSFSQSFTHTVSF